VNTTILYFSLTV